MAPIAVPTDVIVSDTDRKNREMTFDSSNTRWNFDFKLVKHTGCLETTTTVEPTLHGLPPAACRDKPILAIL